MDPKEFLLEDYKQKISYLVAHLGRMWTRFNFFITLEAALLGGKLLLVGEKPSPLVGVIGTILSFTWYLMGAQDRFLADFYRWQVMRVAGCIKDTFGSLENSDSAKSEPKEGKRLVVAAQMAASEYVGSTNDRLIDSYRAWRDSQIDVPVSLWLEHISSWRSRRISTTHLAAWIPLISTLLWGIYTISQQAR